MSNLEWVAVALGVANIILLIRRSIWNFAFALAMVSLYAVIFFEAKLYSDALLQIFFFVINLIGWRMWLSARGESEAVPVRWLRGTERALWIGGTLAATAIWGWGMDRWTDAASPYWDAGVAMASVASQILLARRYIDNWISWVLVDVLAIALYWSRDLQLTAGLYALFLVMSIAGLIEWRRASLGQST